MNEDKMNKADYIFECSWEVCNKVGGIYTVVSTKAMSLVKDYKDNLIMLGPDIWKETSGNPDFIEDEYMFKSWRQKAAQEGLFFRIGRWNIESRPIVILVDFTPYFMKKDEILTGFWDTYKLDSLSGQWDYIEPAMFGYASAKIIESFYNFYINSQDKIIANFHEWMTGTGILYLKENVPQIGCVFTTHATSVGRSIAGNGLPLYDNLSQYNGELMANEFGIRAKYSLEHLSAKEADCFTTVSDITAKECKQLLGKEVDLVTPNGFDDSFVPDESVFMEKRDIARKKIFEVADSMLNYKFNEESLLVINSGRYEFRNKGIDLFIDALAQLNNSGSLNTDMLAVIAIPAGNTGPRKDLSGQEDFVESENNKYTTHYLIDESNDPVIKRIKEKGLMNNPEDKVKIIFVPSYLDCSDGVFDLSYYDFLIGFDISVFPSYYEPWGYTPLESLAFHIPTITTTLAGFGLWVQKKYGDVTDGISVIERTDKNDDYVVSKMAEILEVSCNSGEKEKLHARLKAFYISRIALWENLINFYMKAYSIALDKVEDRRELFKNKKQAETGRFYDKIKHEKPVWKKVLVKPSIPQKLEKLMALSRNLWWTWDDEAIELFKSINKALWKKYHHNPIAMLEELTIDQLYDLENNESFIENLNNVYSRFDDYMMKSSAKPKDQIAYFSMEYGLHDSVKIFSGGLGILAGDYLKEASDSNENIVAVGLLYRYGYFNQKISSIGEQIAKYNPQKFSHMPVIPVRDENDEWIKISFALPGRNLYAKVWRIDVGRIKLYLLDTDLDENTQQDRYITHQLYGGDWQNRMKQEMLLGMGGIRLFNALNIRPEIFHCNEGHAAFIGIERLRCLIETQGLTFFEAMEVVKSSTLFTTHTPVPAGHDKFSEDMIRTYIPHYTKRLNISWEAFMNLGKMNEDDLDEKFSMSVLAAKMSQEMNAVSEIHGKVTREMFTGLYRDYFPEESHIKHVTNGVHLPFWASKYWKELYKKQFGDDFLSNQLDFDRWKKIYDVADADIWELRQKQKSIFKEYLKEKITIDLKNRQEDPRFILKSVESIEEDALLVGFARRFATYKRAHLLFSDLKKLSQLLCDPDAPVRFIYAGKSHPNDKAGQDLIKRIIEVSKMPEFIGKIIFLEDYNICIGKMMIQSVDLWLNTPTRPLEASGTSGEKAIMNGVLNFSVLDGWWAEGYTEGAGWALSEDRTYDNQQFQDEMDAGIIYKIFSEEIIPAYYERNNENVPVKWISYIKKNIAEISPSFTMKRMLEDYKWLFYSKLISRSAKIKEDNYKMAKEIAHWKQKVIVGWESIELVRMDIPDPTVKPLMLGDNFIAEIEMKMNELSGEDVCMEVLFGRKENNEVKKIIFRKKLECVKTDNNNVIFRCNIPSEKAGVFDYVFRLYPEHPLIEYRQDVNLVKWL